MSPQPRDRQTLVVEHDGERIYAEITGDGPPMLLCHGLAGNHAIWWQQVNTLAARFRLITWDQRGFGNSTAVTGDYSFHAAAGDALALLAHLDLSGVHLVGQSMGGFTALRLALTDSRRVGSLTLSTTAAAAPPFIPRPAFDPVQAAWRDRHPVLSRDFCEREPDLAILYNLISGLGLGVSTREILAHMAAEQFTDEELADLPVPVTVLAAGRDEYCPAEVMARTAARFSKAALEIMPDAGHSAYYENPELWNAAVTRAAERA